MYLYTAYILTSKINAIIKLYLKCVVNRTNISAPQKFEKAGEGKFQVSHSQVGIAPLMAMYPRIRRPPLMNNFWEFPGLPASR